jgi:hypothetical protein
MKRFVVTKATLLTGLVFAAGSALWAGQMQSVQPSYVLTIRLSDAFKQKIRVQAQDEFRVVTEVGDSVWEIGGTTQMKEQIMEVSLKVHEQKSVDVPTSASSVQTRLLLKPDSKETLLSSFRVKAEGGDKEKVMTVSVVTEKP